MKIKRKVILLSIIFGFAVWTIDAILDCFIFFEGTFFESFATDATSHEIYIRSTILAIFIVFGIIISRILENQERIKEKLKGSEERLKILFECAPDAIYLHDLKGNFVDGNKAAEELIGYKRGELIGKNFLKLKLLPKEQILRMALNLTKGASLESSQTEMLILNKKDGTSVPVEIRAFPVKIDDEDLVLGIARDVTESKRADEELKNSEEKLRTIFDNVNDEIIYMDTHDRIIEVNRAVEDIFGYRPEEIIGKKFTELDFFKTEHLPKLIEIFKIAVEDGKTYHLVDIEAKHKNGSKVIVEANTSVIKKDGKIDGILVVLRDITERKEAEEEIKQKNEQLQIIGEELHDLNLHLDQKVEERTSEVEELLKYKDEFINQLSHDLKNPLTPLSSLLPILEENEKNLQSKELLDICIRNVTNIKNLILDTLQLARLNSKGLVLDIKEIRIFDVIGSVILDNQTIIEKKDIKVENIIKKEIIVLADELRLKEVFTNLISNAIKFMSYGGKLTIDAKENDGEFATISVKDTGIGLEKETKARIFEGFYKADNSKTEFASTGLGLSICKRIIEKHGGKIWAESPGLGKGTTFYFTILKKTKTASLTVPQG